MRKVKFLGESEPGILVFEDMNYPSDAPRHWQYSVKQILVTPDRYGDQFFTMGEKMARYWGYVS